MNKFLVKFDFETLIDEENIDQITDSNDRTLNDAIDSAVEEVASYIRHRYDFSQVFRVLIPYADATAFVVGDRVYWTETAYNIATTYTIDQRVSYEDNIYSAIGSPTVGPFIPSEWTLLAEDNTFYVCSAISTGNLPTDTSYFTAGDNRNPKIKEITVDVTLYNIHSKISPRNIPDVRRVRYDGFGNKNDSGNAIKYLEQVQKGQITPDLPVIDPIVQNTERFSYGTSPSTKHSY